MMSFLFMRMISIFHSVFLTCTHNWQYLIHQRKFNHTYIYSRFSYLTLSSFCLYLSVSSLFFSFSLPFFFSLLSFYTSVPFFLFISIPLLFITLFFFHTLFPPPFFTSLSNNQSLNFSLYFCLIPLSLSLSVTISFLSSNKQTELHL